MRAVFGVVMCLLAVTVVTTACERSGRESRIVVKAICDVQDDPKVREWWMRRNLLGEDDLEKCKVCMQECRDKSECLGQCVKDSKIVPESPDASGLGDRGWGEAAVKALGESPKCAPLIKCRDDNNCKFNHDAEPMQKRGEWRKTLECMRSKCVAELEKCRTCVTAKNACKTSKCMKPCKQECRDHCNKQCGN